MWLSSRRKWTGWRKPTTWRAVPPGSSARISPSRSWRWPSWSPAACSSNSPCRLQSWAMRAAPSLWCSMACVCWRHRAGSPKRTIEHPWVSGRTAHPGQPGRDTLIDVCRGLPDGSLPWASAARGLPAGSRPPGSGHQRCGQLRPKGDDTGGIEGFDRIVAPLDVVHAYRFPHTRQSEEARLVFGERRIVRQASQVALEQAVIGHVEAHKRNKQPDVGFGDAIAEQERAPIAKMRLEFAQHRENLVERLLIRDLGRGKAGTVDAVVEAWIDAGVERIYLLAKVGGIEVECRISGVAKGGIHHSQDFRGLVVDDGAALLVPEHRNCRPTRNHRIGTRIEFMEIGDAIQLVRFGKAPSVIRQFRLDHGDGDDILKALQTSADEGARRPGTDQRDIEMIAAGLCLKAAFTGGTRAAVRRDPVAEA